MDWRWVAAAGAGLAAMLGGSMVLRQPSAPAQAGLPVRPPASRTVVDAELPDRLPEASARTREDKRFDRYDKDRDGQVTRDEYLAQRRKAFAKLDRDGDGHLSFDEWAVKATTKFAAADRDRSNAMDRAEFATTAVKRKPARTMHCPPASDDAVKPTEES
ncbi:EF-hand domain-containing protein [Sphingomonas abaci]|uniref:EF-hand domain-containing protein n=1 Tax=Sphingomonas abaci TaxID=237611 RepID=A0A7W7EWC1_9SPHN|nr:EF-hand domain-containing protein [Sphingomonas abaci]MBB4615919.1 hypothetical protein [Sphingomonas abaci]